MRTTLNTIYNSINNNLHNIKADLDDINNRISSGRRMSKISDDPVNMPSALRMRSELAGLDQYQENLDFGSSIINASESALTQIKEQISQAKVTVLQAKNSSVNSEQRQNIAEVIRNYRDQIVTLGNTRVDGKYIFGGHRTTGYTEIEPAPFILDKVDGYRINGEAPQPRDPDSPGWLIKDSANLSLGDLEITNETDGTVAIPAADLTSAGLINGLNMGGAANLKTSINTSGLTETSASLTTLISGNSAAATPAGPETVSFDLNGINIELDVEGTAVEVAQQTIEAINEVSEQTGVRAFRGNGDNGGLNNSVVLRNVVEGDESAIDIANLNDPIGLTGLSNINQAADASNNTGYISFTSTEPFTFNDSAYSDGTLDLLGLKEGYVGISEVDANGEPVEYGFNHIGELGLHDLEINGIKIDAAESDGISTIYPTESAAAKAAAINAVAEETGVTATITPTYKQAEGMVEAGTLDSGDLIINGIDIFTTNTNIEEKDLDNTLVNAINSRQEETGIAATRDSIGRILLKAVDGRNLHIETTDLGEAVTRIHTNNTDTAAATNEVYMGQIQLHSEQQFTLETDVFPPENIEYGLEALGLAGGEAVSGQPDDQENDGLLTVKKIIEQTGSVRYAGDREKNLSIKTGRTDSMEVSHNGMDSIMSVEIFSILTKLENYLLGQDFKQVTGTYKAEDLTATLDSEQTGLEKEEDLRDGSFTVKVKDQEFSPPKELTFTIPVDVDQDSLESVAAKINGIPGMQASWNEDNKLEIMTTDDRYSFTLSEDSSNFLKVTGTNPEEVQMQALDDSLAELEDSFTSITSHISDFGARANRIDVQKQIYNQLELKVNENLSGIQDTDYTKAIMDLKAAQTAYQAALSSAGKTMQLSLVDYL